MHRYNNSGNLTFDIRGISIAAKTWGRCEGIPVLALHGWLDNASTFERIAPFLENCFIVAPDFAGHGQSGHRHEDGGYYLWEYALDINEVLHQLGWQHCVVLAHSMGSGVASILCSINNNIGGVIFLDGMGAPFTIKAENTVTHFKRAQRLSNMAKKSGGLDYFGKNQTQFPNIEAAAKERTTGVDGVISLDAARALVERDLVKVNDVYFWRHDPRLIFPESLQLTNQQAEAFVKQISCPLIIMLGREGLFVDTFNEKSKSLPEGSAVFWFDGGHHFHIDCPTNGFLDKIYSSILNLNAKKTQSLKLISGASK